ncbi:catalase family peroxidase [Methylotenera mobilis]|uniref:Catalase-related peroxidase n=1 Tax=Methylotenera mobilis (strain JLW8 / ATCC BAA-1282 / DSM 17540) TaxID=583345 RepID=C6WYN2_METML|nr:catalase family peroxidase [Methylotenera mobilis]ACT47007.1 Catalase domain protein [Methylotenera mobilis JLW8]
MKTKNTLIKSFALTALVFSMSNVYAEDATESDKPVTEQIVNTLTKLSGGPHKGYRANHAKGIVAQGEFVPAKSAASLSSAAHLQTKASPVTVRFSDATGLPTIPDADGNSFPKGIAIRFQLADASYTDIVSISTNGFPAATPEDFLGLLNAIAASGAGAAKPTPIEQFLGSHPAALSFVQMPKPAPVSFATEAYYGVNAFAFTNAQGETQYGRYRITPINGTEFLSKEQSTNAAPNYLVDELPLRLSKAPAKFKISVQLAAKDDEVNDPTVVWPENRKLVELGTLTLKNIDANGVAFEKATMFSPLNLVDGIAASDDQILLARPGAYAVSFGRRFGQ